MTSEIDEDELAASTYLYQITRTEADRVAALAVERPADGILYEEALMLVNDLIAAEERLKRAQASQEPK